MAFGETLVFDGLFFYSPEDLLLGIIRPLEEDIPGLTVSTIIQDDFPTPYVMCRSDTGSWDSDTAGSADRRFMRRFTADIQTWVDGTEADTRNGWLQEIVYLRLYTAWSRQIIVPGVGHIAKLRVSSPAHEVPDWATSTGVNQYAQLPKGMLRYQAKYRVWVRPDFSVQPDVAAMAAAIANP